MALQQVPPEGVCTSRACTCILQLQPGSLAYAASRLSICQRFARHVTKPGGHGTSTRLPDGGLGQITRVERQQSTCLDQGTSDTPNIS